MICVSSLNMKKSLIYSLWIFLGMLAIFSPLVLTYVVDSFKPMLLYFITLPTFLGHLLASLDLK